LLKRTRRELHGKVIGVLGEHFPEVVAAQPELAARHAEAAGMSAEAVGFYRRAAVQAEERSAHEEALLHLQRALDVVLSEAPGIERDRRETAVMEDRVSVLFRARGWAAPESFAALERVRDLSLATGDRRSYGSVLVGLAVSHYLAARLDQALELVDEAIAVAEEIGAVANVITCLTVRGNVAYFQGRFRDALEWSVQAAELYDPVRHHHEIVALAGDDSGVTAMGMAGWAWFQLGGLDRGIARTNEAAALATTLGHSFTLAQARVWELALLAERNDEGREGPASELLHYCEAQGFPAFAGAAQTILGRRAR
jgi:tetratricopeptide (TPR) repeat protein